MSRQIFSAGVFAVVLIGARALAACDSPDTEVLRETVDAAPPPPPPPASEAGVDAGASLSFKACPGQFSGVCTTMEVPLDWAHPEGKKITIFIDKIATSPRSKGVLFLLQGGPGGSGADMIPLARQIAQQRDDVDVYTMDHRGVGLSSRLGCPDEQNVLGPGDGGADAQADAATPIQTCLAGVKAQWGDGLAQFNVTNAARDLKAAIDAVKRPTDKVFVYGVSYGTYWAHRYLQIFPTHPTGVILDSIVPPEGEYVSMFDLHGDPVGQRLAEACKSDATCSAAFGADPWTKAKSIVASIGQGHCPEVGATNENRIALFAFLEIWGANVYPFAALHRFERCTPEDVVALRALFSKTSAIGPPPGLFSPMLNQNIAFSELWETPAPSDATMRQRFDDAVFAAGAGLGPPPSIWPTYPHDEYWGKYAETSVPVLMLNGTYDVQTPIETASRMKDHLNRPHQTFVTIPTADHATINQSPTKDPLTGAAGPPCGLSIIMSFLDDPSGTPDTSCLSQLTKLSFDGDPNLNQFFWGSTTIWTGLPQAKPTAWPEWLPKPIAPHRFLVP